MAFQTSAVQTFVVHYITRQLSERLDANISVARVDISFFNKVILHKFLIEDQKEDTLFYVKKLVASIDGFSIKKKNVDLSSLGLLNTKIYVSLDENRLPNYKFLLDALRTPTPQNAGDWDITCRNFIFDDTRVGYSYFQQDEVHLIDLHNIHLDVTDFVLHRDSTYLKVNRLSFDDDKSLFVNNLSTTIISYQHVIKLIDLDLSTPNSRVTNVNFTLDQTNLENKADYTASMIDLDVKKSTIDLQDVSRFIPAIKGMDLKFDISGHVTGTIANLKAKELKINFGENTGIICDLYINGLPDVNSTYLSIDLKNLSTDFKDIAKVRLPDSFKRDYPDFPSFLFDAGIIRYEGNFTGFLSNFVAYGTLRSNFGRLTTDLSFVPTPENSSLDIKGHLKTVNFQLGKFIQDNKLGAITFNGEINGTYREKQKYLRGDLKGVVDSVMYSSYRYKNLVLDGSLLDRKFEGTFRIDDPNLVALFTGKADMNAEVPVFDFNLLLEKADLVALNIDKKHQVSNLSFDMKANFTGNNIDNINGSIWCEEGQYSNDNNSLVLNSLMFNTFSDNIRRLSLKSDFIDAEVEGSYSVKSLISGIKNIVYRHLPSLGTGQQTSDGENNFILKVDIKDPYPLTSTFIPSLGLSPAKAELRFDEKTNLLDLYTDIPQIRYNNITIKGNSLSLSTNGNFELKSRVEELQIGNGQRFFNLALLSSAQNNKVNAKLIWNNNDEKTYSGELDVRMDFLQPGAGLPGRPHAEIKVLPTKIFVSDTLWTIHPSTITIDSSRVAVDNFKISNKNQNFELNGALSKDKSDRLNISVNHFNLNNLNLIGSDKIDVQGILNGTASVFDVYEKVLFLSDLRVGGFSYNGHHLGDISMLCKWDRPSESLQAELKVTDNEHQSLYGFGNYFPSAGNFDFEIDADRLSLAPLQLVFKKTFSDINGMGTGKLKIYGKSDQILLRGDIYGENAGLKIDFLNTNYTFSDTVSFRGDSIIFNNIKIDDTKGNYGFFNGSIKHDNFSNMDYNMTLSTRKILIMNTTIRENEVFYGQGYGSGTLRITGHAKDLYLDGSIRTLAGTSINISLDNNREAQTYDFIRFVNTKEQETEKQVKITRPDESRLFMKFTLEATPEARFQLDYNSRIGDVIRAQGNGTLQIGMNHNEDMSLHGNFQVEHGEYLFTLQNVINKKFEIEKGGTISWTGKPDNATINLKAIYRLRTSLSELYANTTRNSDYNQRIPVLVKIALTEQLSMPTIGFDIEFPSAEDRIKDEVKQFFNAEEDMNKQILSLLILGRFYTPEYLRGSYESSNSNLVGSTASDLFSNQLSNWLSQINKDWDIGVNYRPGNALTNDEVELALSTQIFNDRITINGNIGNNGTTTTNANNSNIVGDFDMNVKLTNNGKLLFKAYNRSNNNIIYETSPYTQGIGISYTESYDTTNELWRKFKRIFQKRRITYERREPVIIKSTEQKAPTIDN